MDKVQRTQLAYLQSAGYGPVQQRQLVTENQLLKRGVTLVDLQDKRIASLKLESGLFSLEQIKQSPNFAIKTFKDSYYVGLVDFKTNSREGLGVCVYSNGRRYEGSWSNDKRSGVGYELFSGKNLYKGEYVNGQVQGRGVYQWANGDLYDGEWLQGLKHGDGVWKGNQGDSYVGQWFKNMAHGFGIHQWKNGDRYEGQWFQSLRHGQGTDKFNNGDEYIGQYENGKAQGEGVYKWQNGNSYSGQFVLGMKQGKGVWKRHNSNQTNQYEGDYYQDMKHGQGTFKWESGGHYKGSYVKDLKNGYGEMTWPDGSSYRGFWVNGIQNGLGLMTLADGRQYAGTFRDNVLTKQLEPNDLDQFPTQFKQDLQSLIANPSDKQQSIQSIQLEEAMLPNNLIQSQKAAVFEATESRARRSDSPKELQQKLSQPTVLQPKRQVNNSMSLPYDNKQDSDSSIRLNPGLQTKSGKRMPVSRTIQNPDELIFHDFDYVGYEPTKKKFTRHKSVAKTQSDMMLPLVKVSRLQDSLKKVLSRRTPRYYHERQSTSREQVQSARKSTLRDHRGSPGVLTKREKLFRVQNIYDTSMNKSQQSLRSSRSITPGRTNMIKMKAKVWIPNGHANSIKRHQLSALILGRKL